MRLFNWPLKDIDPKNEFFPLIKSLAESANDEHHALGQNLTIDHRVPPARGRRFAQQVAIGCGAHGDPNACCEAVRSYQEKFVQRPKGGIPDFLHHDNKENILSGTHVNDLSVACMDGAVPLATLWKHYYFGDAIRAQLNSKGLKSAAVECHDDAGVLRRLETDAMGTAEVQDQLRHALAESLKCHLADNKNRHEPRWCTTFDALQTHLHRPAGDWERKLGKSPGRKRYFVMVCKYPVSATSGVVRPTCLEAGTSAWHFPTPPSHAEPWGFTLPLAPCDGEDPLPEFIHLEFAFAKEHFHCFGVHDPATPSQGKGSASPSIREQREQHGVWLRRSFGDAVADWLAWWP